MRLEGKVAIITGGASGIGEFTAREMVKEGAKVVIADINDKMGEDLAKELGQDKAAYKRVDVRKENEIADMVTFAVEKFGKLDIIFNNAGIGAMGPSADLPYEDWQKTIDINLTGVFLCSKHAAKEMMKGKGGVIINNASILGHVGQAATAAYTAAKAGVVNLTRTFAVEYAKHGIRAVSVAPGYIETPLLSQLDEQMKQALVALHPIGRLGRPEEIAKPVVFLASDDASFITGASLLIDGGYTAV